MHGSKREIALQICIYQVRLKLNVCTIRSALTLGKDGAISYSLKVSELIPTPTPHFFFPAVCPKIYSYCRKAQTMQGTGLRPAVCLYLQQALLSEFPDIVCPCYYIQPPIPTPTPTGSQGAGRSCRRNLTLAQSLTPKSKP